MSLTSQNIEALIVLCKQGNQLAQLEVYNRYQKAMFNVSLRIVKDHAEAEDIMQESFITAFSKLDSFKGEVPFGAWLKRIVINKCLTQLKKKSRRQEVRLEVVDYKLESDDQDGIGELDYANVKVQAVMTAMDQLKESYKTILNLSLIEGYDNEEIAGILQISNENCRTTISRAKSKLRKIMMESSIAQ